MTDLTPAGRDRKDQMLDALQRRVTSRRRRRRAVRASLVAAPIIAVGAIAWLSVTPTPTAPLSPIAQAPTAPARVESVSFERIDDAELLDLLNEAGCRAGIVRRGGTVTVAFENPDCRPIRPGSG